MNKSRTLANAFYDSLPWWDKEEENKNEDINYLVQIITKNNYQTVEELESWYEENC